MSYMALTLRDLQYVVAVADWGHFGKAAEACHVSQPALSAQIKKVEGILGVTIFERNRRQVHLAAQGEPIVQMARELLAKAEQLNQMAKHTDQPMVGTLKVAAIATLGPYFWPHVLPQMIKKYPKMNLILREGLTDELIQLLRQGAVDAVLASPTFNSQGLDEWPIFFEPFFVAARKDHPMAKMIEVENKDLAVSDMVILAEGHCLKDQSVDLCPANRRGSLLREAHATSIETLRHLVALGQGYSLLPQLSILDDDGLKGMLKYRPMKSAKAGRLIALYTRPNSAVQKDLEELLRFLRANLPPKVREVAIK